MLDGLAVKPQLLVERRQAFVDSPIGGYDYQRTAATAFSGLPWLR